MAKSQLAYGVSLTAVAVMLCGATASAQFFEHRDRGHGGHSGTSTTTSSAAATVTDPGVRGGTPGAGASVGGLTTAQQNFFTAAQARFVVIETVSAGLGPGFNELSCGNCHIFPAVGGSSPTTNPQVTDANVDGATNVIPSFVTATGPIREARFVLNPDGTPDGGVHDLFSIQGRSDASGCVFAQPNFVAALAENNVIFRIPPPTFGDGLVEGVSDLSLTNTFQAQAATNGSLGISGQFNTSGNTGNITRFGWKAQNASMMMFAGEAYNVEEGVTNDLFPDKRNPSASAQCSPNPLPEDTVNTVDTINSVSTVSDNNPDTINFALFMRLLAPPTPVVPISTLMGGAATASAATTPASTSTTTPTSPSTTTVQMASVLTPASGSSATTSAAATSTTSTTSLAAGLQAFINVGCAGCHIVSQTTGNLALIDTTTNPTVSNITINPFSDFAIHNMGTGLADGVSQGGANGSQFRSAPLWGIGQRTFFLHDGRTNNLVTAILQHSSSGSEANGVVAQFQMLSTTDQQNIINFLRSL
jgi:CxxC motif-containing protein (DUF1111 family)